MISWDTETHLIKPGMSAPRLVCGTIDDGKDRRIILRDETLDFVERTLKEDHSVGQHIFFDLGVTAAERPNTLPKIFDAIDAGRVTDTKIRQMMIDNANGALKFEWNEETQEFKKQNYSLGHLVWRHFKKDISNKKKGDDIWRLRYNELDGVPLEQWPEEAKTYALDDATYTRQIWEEQSRDNIVGEKSQIQAAWALYLTGLWGVRTNPDSVAKLRKEVQTDYDKQEVIAQEFGFIRGNGTKDTKKIQAAIESWFKENDMPMKLTPTGLISMKREQLVMTDHPGLHAVAEHGKHGKLLKTYVPALERGTIVPLNPNYNPIVESFRTSCSGGMKIDKIPVGTNLQNPPRKGGVRECYEAREGSVFAFCDYDTLEMLTLAQSCLDISSVGFSFIAEAAKEGQDFHLAFAADMMGIGYKTAEERLKSGDAYIANARQGAKIANYGMAGGMSARTFIEYAKGFGHVISIAEAQRLHDGFRAKWKEMVPYFEYISNLCGGERADVVVHPRTGLKRGKVRYTAAANHMFQHLAAMGAKEALYHVVRECYTDAGSPLYGSRPWLFAHDEIGIEIPIDAIGPKKTHEAAARLQELMIERMKVWCPDVPIAATPCMSRRWYKGAKPIFVDGLLVPVKPEGKGWVADL